MPARGQEAALENSPQHSAADAQVALDIDQPAEGQPPRPAKLDSSPGLSSSSWTSPQTLAGENHELSIEPGTLPLLPHDAPAWVGNLPDLSDDVHRLFVGGQIAESASEAAEGLDTPLVAAVSQYVDRSVLSREGAAQALAGKLTADYVWKNLVDEPAGYVARLNTPGQPMYQKWVTVSITPKQRDEILRWDREAVQRDRLKPIGLGLVSLLGCIGVFHLLIRPAQPRTTSHK